MGYDLQPRYDFRPFRRAAGSMNIGMFFPKEFSEQSTQRQKSEFATVLTDGIAAVVEKLRKKKLSYDLDIMEDDAGAIIKAWARGRSA